ncbi:MAG: carboxymuconolactone decarboxylase family protein [Brevinema sp.]
MNRIGKIVIVLALIVGAATFAVVTVRRNAVSNRQVLTLRHQGISKVAAATAIGNMEALTPALAEALDNGVTVNELKEVLVQMYAYTGFPRSLNGLQNLRTLLEQRKAQGITDNDGVEAVKLDRSVDKFTYGSNLLIRLSGVDAPGAMAEFAPAIDDFLKEHLFADIFARDILNFQDREVATISALTVLPGAGAQLNSHLNVGKNTGLTDAQLVAIQDTAKGMIPFEPTFGKGEPNPSSRYFTGQTYLIYLSDGDATYNSPAGNVTFEPNAKTFWHKHSGGQILLVTDGEGRYQARGQAVQVLKKGDVVRIPPDLEHWHGAAPNSWFSHVALTPNAPNNQVTWLEAVSERGQ